MDIITNLIKNAHNIKEQFTICLVSNVNGLTENFQDYSKFSVQTEFLTITEREEIHECLTKFGFDVLLFDDELDFIRFTLEHAIQNNLRLLVYSTAQKGTKVGRKSLIPAFCDLINIPYVNSNPYVVSLCRNKYHSGCILNKCGMNTPKSWLYSSKSGWIGNKQPIKNLSLIYKLNNEAASIGMDRGNIFQYSESAEKMLHDVSLEFQQDIIVQEFIEGYEVEIPTILLDKAYPIMSVGISIGNQKFIKDQILTYRIRGNDEYDFYDFSMENERLSKNLMQYAGRAAEALGISGYGRIDFRIDTSGSYYITDIATNPHLVKHSSFRFAFESLGFSHEDVFATLFGTTNVHS